MLGLMSVTGERTEVLAPVLERSQRLGTVKVVSSRAAGRAEDRVPEPLESAR
jgi:hypothetical protein